MEIEVRNTVASGGILWHKKGDPHHWHREDGPAIVHSNGEEYWYYYNKKYYDPEDMPLNLFLAYVKWELKKHGS